MKGLPGPAGASFLASVFQVPRFFSVFIYIITPKYSNVNSRFNLFKLKFLDRAESSRRIPLFLDSEIEYSSTHNFDSILYFSTRFIESTRSQSTRPQKHSTPLFRARKISTRPHFYREYSEKGHRHRSISYPGHPPVLHLVPLYLVDLPRFDGIYTLYLVSTTSSTL